MPTVRFSQVVAACGRPEPYTLWSAPESDREFQRALAAHRVMTIHQETVGTKTDYGEVGFSHLGRGNLLVFPKSLKAYEGRRVVGVKYELLQAPAPAPVVKAGAPAKLKTAPKISPKPSDPVKATSPSKPPELPVELRIFRADGVEREAAAVKEAVAKEKASPTPAESVRQTTAAPAEQEGAKPDRQENAAEVGQLIRELRRAMKQLQSGKAVAAYQTLEKALAEQITPGEDRT